VRRKKKEERRKKKEERKPVMATEAHGSTRKYFKY
jgi:hypothetical protein